MNRRSSEPLANAENGEAVSAHTPGPWRLSYDKGSGRDIVASPDPLPICTVKISWVGHKQYHANAHLIAAAPELLSVLQELRECADYWSEYDVPLGIVGRIDTAINKAINGHNEAIK